MKTKLTLSLPEETIQRAKKLAREQNTSVSKLFETAINTQRSEDDTRVRQILRKNPRLKKLSGMFQHTPAFDDRSARLRAKHG